jgi:glycosyltransferase involved in cell wall biosynthesis
MQQASLNLRNYKFRGGAEPAAYGYLKWANHETQADARTIAVPHSEVRLFLDMTRIAYRLSATTPTGIDRVELAYATRLLASNSPIPTFGVFTAPFFSGVLRQDLLDELFHRIKSTWRLDVAASDDVVYNDVATYLERAPSGELSAAWQRRFRDLGRLARIHSNMKYPIWDLVRAPTRLKRRVLRSSGGRVGYINTSHNQLDTPRLFNWARDAGLPITFFVHDTIPIDYPEFVAKSSAGRHERRLQTVSDLASLVIVNSETTKTNLTKYLAARGLRQPETKVLPLGIAEAYLSRCPGRAPPNIRRGHPYFATISTIEPRKNLLFLFAVWRQLLRELGPNTPRLVVIGARGWECENIVDALERSRELGPYLVEVSDLSDAGVAEIVRGACGVLQPSYIEGFGLPVAEALTLGKPVVCSDIAAHREVGGSYALFIDPTDGRNWLDAIRQLTNEQSELAQRAGAQAKSYAPLDWSTHVDKALQIITTQMTSTAVDERR